MTLINYTLTIDQINQITNHINKYRRKHYSNDISYDSKISYLSQLHSDRIALLDQFKRSKNIKYGENLFYFSGYKDKILKLIFRAIDFWYFEIHRFNYEKMTSLHNSSHATQLLWNSSTKFGIGYTYNRRLGIIIVVMNFDPPGNIRNEFKKNIFPKQ